MKKFLILFIALFLIPSCSLTEHSKFRMKNIYNVKIIDVSINGKILIIYKETFNSDTIYKRRIPAEIILGVSKLEINSIYDSILVESDYFENIN